MALTFRGGSLRLRGGAIRSRGGAAAGGGGGGGGTPTPTTPARFVVNNPSPTVAIPVGAAIRFAHAFTDAAVDPATQHVFIDVSDGTAVTSQQYDQEGTTRDGKLRIAAFELFTPVAVPPGSFKEFRFNIASGAKSQAASTATLPTGVTVELDIGGLTWVASLADALTNSLGFKIGTVRTLKDGPVCLGKRAAARFVNGGVGHARLWCRFYPYAYADGHWELSFKLYNGMVEINNYDPAIANYAPTAMRLKQGSTTLRTWGGWDAHYHGAWDGADTDGERYSSLGVTKYAVAFDMAYLAKAYAAPPYKAGLGAHVKDPSQTAYQKSKPTGYIPSYVPGDTGGFSVAIWDASDGPNRQEMAPGIAGWSFANLATGSYNWKRYDIIHSLVYQDMPKNYHGTNGEVPVLNAADGATPYAGLVPSVLNLSWGAGGHADIIMNPGAFLTGTKWEASGGWNGTSNNGKSSPTSTATVLSPDHWCAAHVGAYLATGDYAHLDAMVTETVHFLGHINPASRNITVGGTPLVACTWIGGSLQERATYRGSLTMWSNALFFCDDLHPAKPMVRDMLDNAWSMWATVYASFPTAAKTLNMCVQTLQANEEAKNYTYNLDRSGWRPSVGTVAACLYKLREKTTNADFYLEKYVRGHAQGMMGGGNISGSTAHPGGCMDRCFMYHVRMTALDGGGVAHWVTDWNQVYFRAGPGAGPEAPLIPTGGCTGVNEDGSGADLNGQWQPYFNSQVHGYWAQAHNALVVACMVDDIYGILPESRPLLAEMVRRNFDIYTLDQWVTSPKYAWELTDTLGFAGPRPFGSAAPWNVPVTGLATHPQSALWSGRLYTDQPPAGPGRWTLTFDAFTYPVYDASTATDLYTVHLVHPDWGNLHNTTMPWDPAWQPSSGSDGQLIVLDPATGREWDLWQVGSVDTGGKIVNAGSGSLIPGSYWTKTDGYPPPRGCGIQTLAMLVRPWEVAAGVIRHALSMPVHAANSLSYVAPATKLEGSSSATTDGIPEGMRFALVLSDAEIAAWAASLPAGLGTQGKNSAAIIARALRDYGWIVTDTGGAVHLQFEDRLSAGAQWTALGLAQQTLSGRVYPRDLLLTGLFTADRVYAIVPSDQY